MTTRLWVIIIIGILAVGNVYFGLQTFLISKNLEVVRTDNEVFYTNKKVLVFTKMFVDDVLRAEGEVDFDTRLKLENAVRDIKDDDILTHWNAFVKSKTQAEAQEEVKKILSLLISKIQ